MDLKLALKVSDKDNVATIFADGIVDGTEVEIRDKRGDSEKVNVIGDVPFGHKIAVRDMLRGHAVIIPGLGMKATLAARRLAPDWLMPRITYHIQHNKISRKRKK